MEENVKTNGSTEENTSMEVNIPENEKSAANSEKTDKAPTNSIDEFLKDENNKKKAQQDAFQLWAILTKNSPMDKAPFLEFTRTQVVHKTNLSHKKASVALSLLHMFGYIQPTNKVSFKFVFEKQDQTEYLQQSIRALYGVIKNDWQKFTAKCEPEQVEEMKQEIINAIFN